MNKKQKILIILIMCLIFVCLGIKVVLSKGATILYNAEDKAIMVANDYVDYYLINGWYTKPVVTMYAPDGRTIVIYADEIETYKNVGWYIEPVTTVYSSDGREECISLVDKEAFLNVGWYNTKEEAIKNSLKQEDIILLARVINAEASPHNYTDKCYVGAVVMNRLQSGYWGDTLFSVISAKGQYSCYGNKAFNSTPPQDCINIATQLLLGERYGMPNNVLFQSGMPQGNGIWAVVDNGPGYYKHYYCYK